MANDDFPKTPAEFEQDTRVAYSAAESKWILEDDDGSEWEYHEMTKQWVPAVSVCSHPERLHLEKYNPRSLCLEQHPESTSQGTF